MSFAGVPNASGMEYPGAVSSATAGCAFPLNSVSKEETNVWKQVGVVKAMEVIWFVEITGACLTGWKDTRLGPRLEISEDLSVTFKFLQLSIL